MGLTHSVLNLNSFKQVLPDALRDAGLKGELTSEKLTGGDYPHKFAVERQNHDLARVGKLAKNRYKPKGQKPLFFRPKFVFFAYLGKLSH